MMRYTVYRYRVLRLHAGEAPMLAQMHQRAAYWNRLVELERAYRARVEAIVGAASEELAQLGQRVQAQESRLEEALAQQRRERQASRSRAVSAETRARVTAARAALREVRQHYRDLRRTTLETPQVKAALWEAEHERRKAMRQARQAAVQDGIWWGNWKDVDESYQRTRQGAGGHHLRFQPSRKVATVSVWFQQGLPVAKVWGADSRLQLTPVTGPQPRAPRTTFRLRVGTQDRAPVYVEGTVVLHRPLPEGGIIRVARLTRERVGTQWDYYLTVTVATPESTEQATGPMVGVDIGWRLMPDGSLRVAYAADEAGWQEELRLPAALLSRFRKVQDLESIRGRNFNAAKAALLAWLEAHEAIVPDWLREATATLAQWRAPARLAALAHRWREARSDGDADGYGPLEAWRRQDKHLLEWEAHLRLKARNTRADLYRNFAARLTRLAGAIVMEQAVVRQVTGREEVEQVAWQRSVAAASSLQSIIVHTAAREGVRVLRVPAAWTTQVCYVCERRVEWDAERELLAQCPTCGNRWDQDYNAARNLAHIGRTGQPLAAPSGRA